MSQSCGKAIGFMAWLVNSRKQEILERIESCLEVDTPTAKGIQKRMYLNLGVTVAEFLRMPHMKDQEVRDLISYQNAELVPEDRKFIALVAHTGNWEILAATTPFFGYGNMNVVVKSLKPEKFNEWLCKVRSRWGTKYHDRHGSSRSLLRVLKTKEPLGFVLDQNTKVNMGIFVNFFGKPACTSDGLAQLAAISGYTILPVFCRRDTQTLKLIVEVGEAIRGPEDRSESEILRVTQECTDKLETFIRKYPDQWIWMHRRWRTQKPE
ncbi:lysophospholipid acyltransferase family protein [Kiritimatiellota bacterium B12222]|nr:lysophospholipid acyltransferase family protein [Kiritimatiellota bacterium B12222]